MKPEAEPKPKRTRSAAKVKRAPRKKAAAKKSAKPVAESPRDISEPEPQAAAQVATPVSAHGGAIPSNGEASPEAILEGESPAPRRRGWWQKFT